MVDVTVMELEKKYLGVHVTNDAYRIFSISASGTQDYVDENRSILHHG